MRMRTWMQPAPVAALAARSTFEPAGLDAVASPWVAQVRAAGTASGTMTTARRSSRAATPFDCLHRRGSQSDKV
jgi:hypothetical protein